MGPDRSDSFDFDALYLRTKTLSSRVNGYCFNLLFGCLAICTKIRKPSVSTHSKWAHFGHECHPIASARKSRIAARVLGVPGGADILDVLMRPDEGGALSKEQDEWGRVVYKTRGRDQRGSCGRMERIRSIQECPGLMQCRLGLSSKELKVN